MHPNSADAFPVSGAKAPSPSCERLDRFRPLTLREARTEENEGVVGRHPLAEPRPAPADGHLDLDHRLQPVDVGSLEKPDLDQSHGSGRIATRPVLIPVVSPRPTLWL